PALIAGIFIIAGGAGGFYLKSSGSADASTAPASSHEGDSSDHDKKSSGHGEDKKAKDGHGKDSSGENGDVTYHNFTREFVVPIIRNEQVVSLVILNLNLEVDNSISGKLFSMEPKLRDNIMTTLIGISNDGKTFNSMTEIENYEYIRATVLKNLQDKVATEIRNVLIMDMARQDL
ncbi:MAG: hypothetical protein WA989_16935, partial [Henriciella sp.]|uniref:hypothetical protein n=1 Tax=Henriciella sp. TaxID=1968823 RepID=UPI003C7748D3